MVSKMIEMSKKNIFLRVFIKVGCFFIFSIVSIWNEVMGYLRSKGIGGKSYKKLLDLKDTYKGKRCFIIATGPSLTFEDLDKLKEEYTFGMNSIVSAYDKTDFRPTFYGIQDHIVYNELEEAILRHYENEENVFVADRIKWHFDIGKNWKVFPLNMSYHAYKRWFKEEFEVKFSDDIYRSVYSGFSITYSLIEIAVYMGFSEIYLIGADCSFLLDKKHFIEYGVVDKTIDTAAQRNIAGYLKAKEYTEANNIKIYNATRGGALEIFERVNIDDILN